MRSLLCKFVAHKANVLPFCSTNCYCYCWRQQEQRGCGGVFGNSQSKRTSQSHDYDQSMFQCSFKAERKWFRYAFTMHDMIKMPSVIAYFLSTTYNRPEEHGGHCNFRVEKCLETEHMGKILISNTLIKTSGKKETTNRACNVHVINFSNYKARNNFPAFPNF